MDKIALIKAEIERLKNENDNIRCDANKAYCQGYNDAFVDLLPFLDTLSEEPDKSLEEVAEEYVYSWLKKGNEEVRELFPEATHDAFIAGVKWQADHTPLPEDTVLFHKGVKEGRRLERDDIMKDAIHYVVQDDFDHHGASYNIPLIRIETDVLKPKGIEVGDKVCIIIVKEEKNGQSD